MTIEIRPHHLLCVLTYIGKGYSGEFTGNFDSLIARINAGETSLRLADGPDDICRGNPGLICGDSTCDALRRHQADVLALADIKDFLGISLKPGDQLALTPELIRKLKESFKTGKIRRACHGCVWHDLCSGIAADGFAQTRLTGC